MVKSYKKEIEVFVNEYTGAEYKTKQAAEKSEKKSLLYNIVKESRFDSVEEIKDYLLLNQKNSKVRILASLDWNKTLPQNLKLIPEAILDTDKFFEGQKEKTIIFILDGEEVLRKTLTNDELNNEDFIKEIASEIIDFEKTSFVKVQDENNEIYKYIYKTRESKPVVDEWKALNAANVLEWDFYKETLYDYKYDIITDIYLSDKEVYYALENNGVDNWSGYEYAIELAEEDGEEYWVLDEVDKLTYLENAGVDNWDYYFEALHEAREEKFDGLSKEDYLNIWNEIPKNEKTKWENYSLFLDYLYGNKELQ